MHLHPQSEIGASRPIHFLSERLLSLRSAATGVALCGPGENAQDAPGQPANDGLHAQNQGHGDPGGGCYSI